MGLCRNIDAATPQKLEAYKNGLLARENIFLCLTGNAGENAPALVLEAAKAIPLFTGTKKHDNRVPPPPGFCRRSPELFVKEWRYTQLHFAFDVRHDRVSHLATDAVYRVLFDGMSALMSLELRERRHLIYSIDDLADEYENLSNLRFSFDTDPARLLTCAQAVAQTLDRIKRGDFDFDVYLRRELTIWQLMRDDFYQLNENLAFEAFMNADVPPIDYDAPLLGRYARISKEEVTAAAREIFRPSNLIVEVTGKKTAAEKQLPALREALSALH